MKNSVLQRAASDFAPHYRYWSLYVGGEQNSIYRITENKGSGILFDILKDSFSSAYTITLYTHRLYPLYN